MTADEFLHTIHEAMVGQAKLTGTLVPPVLLGGQLFVHTDRWYRGRAQACPCRGLDCAGWTLCYEPLEEGRA